MTTIIKILSPLMCVYLLYTIPVSGETHELDLEKAVAIAIEQSYQMRMLKENLLEAEFDLKAATNQFKTRVNLNLKTPNYTETMRRFEDSSGVYYSPIKQSIYESDLTIHQPLPTDGNLYLSSGVYSLQDIGQDTKTAELSARLGFNQPIEALYYNELKTSLRQAKLHYELSQKQLQRAQLDLNYQVSQAFYNLVSDNERVNIARQTLDYQQEAFDLAQNKYKAGVIAEVDALQMEVDLGQAMNDHDKALATARDRANGFKQLLGIPLQDSIVIQSSLTYNIVEVDVDDAVKRGLANRLEIREQEISKELAGISIKRTKLHGQVTGTVSAYYDFIGIGENDRSVAYATLFSDANTDMRSRPGNRGVSLNISIPIWDWGVNKARVEAARANLRRAQYSLENERVSVKRDILETVNNLQSSLKRLQLLEKSIVVAEKSFQISQTRFANGDIDSQTLALNRNRQNQAYISHLEAYISYKLNLSDLTRKTFYDYEKDEAI